jgi:hypothetical protein
LICSASVHVQVDGKPVEVQNDYVFILIGGNSAEEFLKKTGVGIMEKSLAVNTERTFA